MFVWIGGTDHTHDHYVDHVAVRADRLDFRRREEARVSMSLC